VNSPNRDSPLPVRSEVPPSHIGVTSQPRRHGNQPAGHGPCEGGFDDFVEAGEDKGIGLACLLDYRIKVAALLET